MASASIAIPLAIGSGGTSLAITTGAGALIGAVLADDRHYFRGALRGAWDASGMSVLDPLLFKGPPVIIPQGTPIALRLTAPAEIPLPAASGPAENRTEPLPGARSARPPWPRSSMDASRAVLSTSARLLNQQISATRIGAGPYPAQATQAVAPASSDTAIDALADVAKFIEQKNLAAAMQALDIAAKRYPDDPRVVVEQRKLILLVTGQRARE